MTAATLDDLTGVDLGLVDETHEDRVCERHPRLAICHNRAEAVRSVEWSCGCVSAYCVVDFDLILATAEVCCPIHDDGRGIHIVRTWPVTR